jgi:hypothetical protein
MPDITSKAGFAARLGVSRARISQLISAKQIYGDALVGEGRTARINVVTACAQLKKNLDPAQFLGSNGKAKLDDPGTAADATSTSDVTIKAERLLQLELMNQKSREDRAARTGRYTLADAARQQMGNIAGQMLVLFEGWLGQIATKIAAKFSISQRDVLHLLRSEFRIFRASAAGSLRQQAQQLPELVEDEGADPVGDEVPAPLADGPKDAPANA